MCCGQSLAKFALKISIAGRQNIYFFLLFGENFGNFFLFASCAVRCHVLRDPGEVLGIFCQIRQNYVTPRNDSGTRSEHWERVLILQKTSQHFMTAAHKTYIFAHLRKNFVRVLFSVCVRVPACACVCVRPWDLTQKSAWLQKFWNSFATHFFFSSFFFVFFGFIFGLIRADGFLCKRRTQGHAK